VPLNDVLVELKCYNDKNFLSDFKAGVNMNLRWLITVSSTFQEVDFDGSLLPLFIT